MIYFDDTFYSFVKKELKTSSHFVTWILAQKINLYI